MKNPQLILVVLACALAGIVVGVAFSYEKHNPIKEPVSYTRTGILRTRISVSASEGRKYQIGVRDRVWVTNSYTREGDIVFFYVIDDRSRRTVIAKYDYIEEIVAAEPEPTPLEPIPEQ